MHVGDDGVHELAIQTPADAGPAAVVLAARPGPASVGAPGAPISMLVFPLLRR